MNKNGNSIKFMNKDENAIEINFVVLWLKMCLTLTNFRRAFMTFLWFFNVLNNQ